MAQQSRALTTEEIERLEEEEKRKKQGSGLPATLSTQQVEALTGAWEQKPPWYDNYLGLIRPILAGAQSGMAGTMGVLDKAATFVSKKLGIPKGGAFGMIERDLNTFAQANRQRGVGGVPGAVAEGLGGAAVAVPELAILGPYGMAVKGAAEGAASGGLPGAVVGGLQGGLSQGILKGTAGLNLPGRVGAGAAFGAATTPGGVKERVAGAATMGGLGALGGERQQRILDLREGPKIKTEAPKAPSKAAQKRADIRTELGRPGINLLDPKIGPMDDQVVAVRKITKAIRAAEKPSGVQKELYRKQYGERFAAGEEAIKAGGLKGEEALKARKAAMAGTMEKTDFSPIAKMVEPEYKKTLLEMIEDSPLLRSGEKISAYDGLQRLLGDVAMKVPQPKQIELLSRVLGSDFTSALTDKMGMTGWQLATEVANVPKTAMSIADLSMGFRQAVFVFPRHPVLFARTVFKDQIKYFANKKNYTKGMAEIESRQNFPLAMKYGLDLIDIKGGPIRGEERMMAAGLVEKSFGTTADVLKKAGVPVVWRIPDFLRKITAGSNQAYTGGLNKIRADLFDLYINNYKRMGLNPFGSTPEVEHLMTKTASAINTMTGRGPIARTFNEAAALTNAVAFSPRLISSRLHLMNPLYYTKLPKGLRKEVTLTGLAFLSSGLATLQLIKMAAGDKVDIETKLTSSDAFKVKVGKTRLDIWGGFQQYAVALSRILTNKTTSTKGVTRKLGEGYKADTRADVALRLLRSKMAPVPGLAWDWMAGESMVGEPFVWHKDITDIFYPMVWADIQEIIKEDPGVAQSLMGLAGIFGAGVQVHGKRRK